MRIAHVTDCYLPRMGGIERQVEGLVRAQRAAGHDVHIITSVPLDDEPTTQAQDFVHRPERRGGPTGGIRYSNMLSGRRHAVSGDFDVVHVHVSTFSPMAYLAAGATSERGIPTVVTLHSLWSYATPVFRAFDLGLGWRNWPITWTAVSTVAAGSLAEVLHPGTEVSVLPNAVAPERWQVARGPADPDRVQLASVMRLAPRKRPLQFLRMLQQVRSDVPARIELHVKIVGDGPKRAAMQRYLRRHGMSDWVELTGQLPQDAIREVFATSDLYVSPATLESFGIAALEARSAGLPVVAFARSGVSDFVVDGEDGLLVSSDGAMVDAISALASSARLRESMTVRRPRTSSPYSWENILRTCDEAYARAGVPAALCGAAAR